MFIIDGKEYRNIEEQVKKNKEDIAVIQTIDRVLADYGIKIVGQIASPELLPGATEANPLPEAPDYTGEYGDAFAVGESHPYEIYIYTRADFNAGYSTAYWLNVGTLAIEGPQGEQGEQGPAGKDGKSSKWYVGPQAPNSDPQYNEGDMYLNTSMGNVYRFNGAIWTPQINIVGPQGVQGPQGIPGEQGPQGVQGPQGATGDVGGLVNIKGIVASTNLLPNPVDLGNPTAAYLVGANEPYDLYIQVGETPQEAIWTNMGPMNVATLVSVDGQYQNLWNADTKVDKINDASAYYRAYTISPQGEQGAIAITPNNIAYAIIQRRDGGQITVPIIPQQDSDATSRKYVADYFLQKYSGDGTNYYMYTVYPNGNQSRIAYNISAIANNVPVRGEDKTFFVGEPVNPGHPATKNYVDNALGSKLDKIAPQSGYYKLYAVGPFDQTSILVAGGPNNIPQYYDPANASLPVAITGVLATATPVLDKHAANKKYVDDAIAALRAELT